MAALLDTAHDVAGHIRRGEGLDIVARAWLIAAGRNREFERLVRPLRVVDVAPALERRSARRDRRSGAGSTSALAAVEAFVLAHGLWMIGPRMADPYAVLDQPDPERGITVARPSPQGEPLSAISLSGRP